LSFCAVDGPDSVGIGEAVFIKFLGYYKTLDAGGAAFYWEAYSREKEE